MTKSSILPLTFLIITACDWLKPANPCANGSPLAPDGSPVAKDCEECGKSPCPDETGETGDELDDDVWCVENDPDGLVLCADLTFDLLASLADWVSLPLDSCGELSQPYECSHLGQTIDCYQCEALVHGDWAPTQQAPSNDGWHLCWVADWQRYVPAFILDVDVPTADWVPHLQCGSTVDAGACSLGFVETIGETATCRCSSDADCQPGTVCEANVKLINGQFRATECTWDGAPFTVGPEIYGLNAWEDGIIIDGDDIILTPEMGLALLPRDGKPFALMNDDQRVDRTGTITRCGSGSLCEHLGLHEGDRLVPRSSIDEFVKEGFGYLEIIPPGGRSRWLTLSIE